MEKPELTGNDGAGGGFWRRLFEFGTNFVQNNSLALICLSVFGFLVYWYREPRTRWFNRKKERIVVFYRTNFLPFQNRLMTRFRNLLNRIGVGLAIVSQPLRQFFTRYTPVFISATLAYLIRNLFGFYVPGEEIARPNNEDRPVTQDAESQTDTETLPLNPLEEGTLFEYPLNNSTNSPVQEYHELPEELALIHVTEEQAERARIDELNRGLRRLGLAGNISYGPPEREEGEVPSIEQAAGEIIAEGEERPLVLEQPIPVHVGVGSEVQTDIQDGAQVQAQGSHHGYPTTLHDILQNQSNPYAVAEQAARQLEEGEVNVQDGPWVQVSDYTKGGPIILQDVLRYQSNPQKLVEDAVCELEEQAEARKADDIRKHLAEDPLSRRR